jgi:hypothetical protein
MLELPAWAAEWDGEAEALVPHLEELEDPDCCEVFASKHEAFWQGYATGRLEDEQPMAAISRALARLDEVRLTLPELEGWQLEDDPYTVDLDGLGDGETRMLIDLLLREIDYAWRAPTSTHEQGGDCVLPGP